MKKHHGNVLVLGHGDRAFLSVIRSLGRAGLKVHVAMCEPHDVAIRSRYVIRRHKIPDYCGDGEQWLEAMDELLEQTPFQFVIPCDDPSLIPLQIHQQRLGHRSKLYVLSDEAFEIAFSKIKSFQLAQKLNIPQPRTAIVRVGQTEDAVAGFSLPFVVKPPSSFTPDDLSRKRGVVRCRTHQELTEQLKQRLHWEAALVQENFIGTGVGVEFLACKGKILVAFQHVRVHEPLEGGGSSYRRSAALHPELFDASKAIVNELKYTGVGMVEFKFNFETSRWVFIEINGRFWGSLPLAIAAGVDFPKYLYEMWVDGKHDFPTTYRAGLYCRNLSSDQRWMRSNLTADKHDPLLATRPLRSVVGEGWNLLTLRERFDTWTWDDPVPGLVDIQGIFADATHKVTRSITRTIQGTYPVRARLCSRILQRLRSANSILFICKGNICRSPYAEHYARKRWPNEITVRSCGYYPARGRSSPEVAQQVAKEFGIDLSGHESESLREDWIQQADLIFTFDEQNRETLLHRFPSVSDRVFGLGLLCSDRPYHLADPYGDTDAGFRKVYAQITEAIETLSAGFTSSDNVMASRHPILRKE